MKKTSFFIAVIVIFVSILAIYGIVTVMMDNTGKINQGTYSINDVMSKSTIVYNEKEIKNEGKNGLSDISFDLTQDNLLSVLVAKNVNAKRIYINNVNISTPKYHGNMYISQNNTEEKISNDSAEKELNIYPDELDGEYFFELKIVNENIIQNASLPSDLKVATFDGTLLRDLSVSEQDVTFKVKFDLNIIDESGKLNTCNFNLDFPKNGLVDNGISITREDFANFVFTVK